MERGLIRSAVPEDAERLLEIYAYYVLNTAVTYEDTVPALPDFRSSMEKVLERYPFLVLCAEGRVQGYACARAFYEHAAFAHCCQLTIYLDPSSVRHGYGRQLYEALETSLRDMEITNLYACIGVPAHEADAYLTRNSEQFHAHLGFRRIGTFHRFGRKFGHAYHMIWMEKILEQDPMPGVF